MIDFADLHQRRINHRGSIQGNAVFQTVVGFVSRPSVKAKTSGEVRYWEHFEIQTGVALEIRSKLLDSHQPEAQIDELVITSKVAKLTGLQRNFRYPRSI